MQLAELREWTHHHLHLPLRMPPGRAGFQVEHTTGMMRPPAPVSGDCAAVAAESIVCPEANTGIPQKGELERMARRRYQDPKPFKRGEWWCLLTWQDAFEDGRNIRKRKWHKLAPATMPSREVQKLAAELVRPLNQGLETIGGATNFNKYVDEHYIPVALKKMASSTQDRSEGVIENYLKPAFGKLCLRDLTPMTLDKYFAGLVETDLSQESIDKVRDVLASILKRAIRHGLLVKNPTEGLELPRAKTGRRRSKPYITPAQFDELSPLIPEPYATMVYVAVYTGLRISELAALR